MPNLPYDAPNTIIRREETQHIVGASARRGFMGYQARSAKALHAKVIVAGTGTDLRLEYTNGTASLGVIALSTSAVGTTSSVTLGTALGSLQHVEVINKSDATGQVLLTLEYEVDRDADPT